MCVSWIRTINYKEKVVRNEASTLLAVFIGEMGIFLPGRLCKLAAWGSVSVMVLWGITGEFWVRTLPKDIASKSLRGGVQKHTQSQQKEPSGENVSSAAQDT